MGFSGFWLKLTFYKWCSNERLELLTFELVGISGFWLKLVLYKWGSNERSKLLRFEVVGFFWVFWDQNGFYGMWV